MPLDIDIEAIRQRAAQLLGVSISDLPVAKAQRAAEEIRRYNPPRVDHERPEPEVIKMPGQQADDT